ncbi:MAG: 3-hydroxyacyl-CoA dehydrogenase/enoyl-CoA hydratase family protein [Flavobacteriales bacterium]
MKRNIKKIAVLGSGVMGSRIACHFANIGVEVLLLDIVPKELNEAENKAGLTLENPKVRNRIVNDALEFALKSNPSPVYYKGVSKLIKTGNFDDNMKDIAQVDWIIEVVVENLKIKQIVFDQVEKYRKPGTIITSNTSGIPIHMMTEGRSDDFKKYFCGSHFFNPPRYLKLLEIIPTSHTDPALVDFLMDYGDRFLGKTTVLCKDTPAFIANRIGVFSIMALFHLVKEMGLTVEEVDKLSGPVLGRPKSATFRTCDVVGLDTLVNVANGLKENCPNDEMNHLFTLPDYVAKMAENKWLGDKTGQGFYKKVKGEGGKSEILALDLNTLEYKPQQKVKFATLESTKTIDKLQDRYKVLVAGKDKAGEFYRSSFFGLFAYVANRIPEISDELYRIDEALKAGFGWEAGPFESWDYIGVADAVKAMEDTGIKVATWVKDMMAAGFTSFYTIKDGRKYYYDIAKKEYVPVPGMDDFIILSHIPKEKVLWGNTGTTIKDLGDGVLNVEFHTKMNSIGSDVLMGINKAIDMAEKNYRGLVISNEGANFSAGANLAMVFMMAVEQEYDEIDFSIRAFQNTVMRVRYSSIPVIVAPHGLALGGGCEICLHADKVVAAAETYIGLVEFGVGVIPAGGGTKEFALRFSDELKEGDIAINALRERFLTIGQAKVATSAHEAFDLGIFRKGKDRVVLNASRRIAEAKKEAILMAEAGYTKPVQRKDIKVMGQSGLGIVYVGANSMLSGGYISEHDKLISEKLGYVLCGGDLSEVQEVDEQYLLDLEREAFLSLLTEKKTLERIQSILTSGKVLRN